MKKQLASHTAFLQIMAAFVVCCLMLASCKDEGSHEVVTKSCVDEKDYNSEYAKQLNSINHFISAEEGMKYTQSFERAEQAILSGQYKGDSTLFASYETFNLKAIDSLLCQQNAVGFRIYTGLDDKGKIHYVLVGVRSDGTDVLQSNGKTGALLQPLNGAAKVESASGAELVLEAGQRHPPIN